MVDGKKMAYKSFGLENRKPGEPVLVFESGFGSGGGAYEVLFPLLSKKVAGIAYDRNGLGESEIDTSLKNDGDVARRLHATLKALKIEPPYVLVGHSLGGPFIRMFVSVYPEEVAGMVFIDPTDFMLTKKEDEEVKALSGSSMGYRELRVRLQDRFMEDTTIPPGIRQEAKRVNNTWYFREYTSLKPLPDIPVTILISYNAPPNPNELADSKRLNINIVPWFKEVNRFRIQHFAAMIANNHNSSMILLPGYSHGIHHQDPALGAAVILDLYNKVIAKSSNK